MERFSVIDHFLTLKHSEIHSDIVHNLFVDHHVDNCSDHDPLFLDLYIDISRRDFASRVSGHGLNWLKANCESSLNYGCELSNRLSTIKLPVDALLCTDMLCSNAFHRSSLNEYCNIISKSCLKSGLITIPSCDHKCNTGIPGWKDHIKPMREKSLLWHHIWIEAGRPGKGVSTCIYNA